jgi:hypothetical protein
VLDGSGARVESASAREPKAAKGVEVDGEKRDFIAHLLNAPKGCLGDESAAVLRLTLRDISFD